MNSNPLILVVDDDVHMLKAHVHILESNGFQTLEATTGNECLRLVQEQKPDLILLDVNLPDMDGRAVCKQIKATPTLADTFIAHLSATAKTVEDQIIGLESGADAYVTLPLSSQELLARVQAFVRTKEMQKKIKQSEAFLNITLNSVSNGVVTVGLDGLVVLINEPAQKLSGFAGEDAIGKLLSEVIRVEGEASAKFDELIAEALAKDERIFFECRVRGASADAAVSILAGSVSMIKENGEDVIGAVFTLDDVTQQRQAAAEKERLISELREALENVKKLSGLLPICAECKKIRDDEGYWKQIEVYIRDHSEADFSHGLCPGCLEKLYPELHKDEKMEQN